MVKKIAVMEATNLAHAQCDIAVVAHSNAPTTIAHRQLPFVMV